MEWFSEIVELVVEKINHSLDPCVDEREAPVRQFLDGAFSHLCVSRVRCLNGRRPLSVYRQGAGMQGWLPIPLDETTTEVTLSTGSLFSAAKQGDEMPSNSDDAHIRQHSAEGVASQIQARTPRGLVQPSELAGVSFELPPNLNGLQEQRIVAVVSWEKYKPDASAIQQHEQAVDTRRFDGKR